MKVAVLCEFSGIVRDAFRERGHDAISCDLLPTERPGPHLTGDLLSVDWSGYDLVVAHPPCTYLSSAGLHLCAGNAARTALRQEAVDFVKRIWDIPVSRLVIENPVGHLSTGWRKPDQIVYMNDFGHAEARKPTCLWFRGVPKLVPTLSLPLTCSTTRVNGVSDWYGKTRNVRKRSLTFSGFAAAMAEQWGNL